MFRRTSSCHHFTTSPPPPPSPPSSSSGEDDKEPTRRRPLPRCRLQLPPPTRPTARHAAAARRIRPLPSSPSLSQGLLGFGRPAVLGSVDSLLGGVRQTGRILAAFFAGI